jgi:predicted RNase H-like HicB family nuclease
MSKYAYPALFIKEDAGYSINFPDLEGCYTCGNDLEEGIENAEDALALVLYGYEVDKKKIPTPSKPKDIPVEEGQFVNFIRCDTMDYRKELQEALIRKIESNSLLSESISLRADALFERFFSDCTLGQCRFNS